MKERHKALPAELLQDANHFIPPAVFSRAAQLTFRLSTARRRPPDLEPRDLERPGPAVPALPGGRQARRQLPGLGHHRRHGPEHHGDELQRPMDFGIVADRDQMPDLPKLMEWLGDGLEELRAAVAV